MFSKKIETRLKESICTAQGGIHPISQGKYLVVVTRTKDQSFGFTRDNVKKRLNNWKNKLLGVAGKEIMLKAAIGGHAILCNVLFHIVS